jgi:hypothetical protein
MSLRFAEEVSRSVVCLQASTMAQSGTTTLGSSLKNARAATNRSPRRVVIPIHLTFVCCLVFPFDISNGFPQFRRRVRHIDMIDSQRSERVHDGVRNGWRSAVCTGFADAFDP